MLLEQFKQTTEELLEERRKRDFDIDKFCKYEITNMMYRYPMYSCRNDDVYKYIKDDSIEYNRLTNQLYGFYSSDAIFVPFLNFDVYTEWKRVYDYYFGPINAKARRSIEEIFGIVVQDIFERDSKTKRPLPFNVMDCNGDVIIKKEYDTMMYWQEGFMVPITPSMMQKYANMSVEESEKHYKETLEYLEWYLSLDEEEKEFTNRKWSEYLFLDKKNDDGSVPKRKD